MASLDPYQDPQVKQMLASADAIWIQAKGLRQANQIAQAEYLEAQGLSLEDAAQRRVASLYPNGGSYGDISVVLNAFRRPSVQPERVFFIVGIPIYTSQLVVVGLIGLCGLILYKRYKRA